MSEKPTPTFLPPYTGWEHGYHRRYLDRNGYHDPSWMLAKVKTGPDWNRLDDVLRDIVGRERGPADLATGYAFIPKRYAEQLTAEFTRLGHADRLDLRLLPDPPAGQITLDGKAPQ